MDWERAIIELAGAVWVLEALNIALVGANVDEKPNFFEKFQFSVSTCNSGCAC